MKKESAAGKKKIAILGATGSIGQQALEIISDHPELFDLVLVTAHKNTSLIINQAQKYKPKYVLLTHKESFKQVKQSLNNSNFDISYGQDMLCSLLQELDLDIVLTAMVGFAGLKPTLAAIGSGKNIALANKETLVVGGEIITREAKKNGVSILPVDSEHSAIFQCLQGEDAQSIEKIYLTASGGPFRNKNISELKDATVEDALNHPNWDMGAKITVDSATLMNKGLEIIEAKWLFNLPIDKIDVIVHPQSIIHSIVQFKDSSMKAQMGLPDMRLPILYAFGFPNRIKSNLPRFNFLDYPTLTFETPRTEVFRNLSLAFDAIKTCGNHPCILNAANEISVAAFLNKKIGFLEIAQINEECLNKIPHIINPNIDELLETDSHTRHVAQTLIEKK